MTATPEAKPICSRAAAAIVQGEPGNGSAAINEQVHGARRCAHQAVIILQIGPHCGVAISSTANSQLRADAGVANRRAAHPGPKHTGFPGLTCANPPVFGTSAGPTP